MKLDRRRFIGYTGAALVASQLSACGPDKRAAAGVPRSRFGDASTAEEVTAGLNLDGRVAVVTGCTSGIGFETMRVLAMRGAYIIGSSRSLQRATDACRKVAGVCTPVELDLGDFESVVQCAETIRAMRTPIDMLICNAGYLGGSGERELLGGVEKHFAINHLGHFIFVNRLLDRLYLAEQGRIVIVASRTAYTAAPEQGILFDDLDFSDDYSDFAAYGHSKLANVLFSLQLARMLQNTRISSNSLHPGLVATDIGRNLGPVMRFGQKVMLAVRGKTIEQGAATSCYVATNDALATTSGAYFEDCNAVTVGGNHHLYDEAMAAELMRVSEQLTDRYLVDLKRPTRNNPFNDPVDEHRDDG